MCLCITSRAEKRSLRSSSDRRPPHVCSIMIRQQKKRASGLGWTSARLPHIQRVHMNLRTNPVDPSSPLQKLTHTITLIVSCILNSTDNLMSGIVSPNAGYTVSVRRTNIERLGPVDPGISTGVTDLYPSRGHTHRVHARSKVSLITRSLQS